LKIAEEEEEHKPKADARKEKQLNINDYSPITGDPMQQCVFFFNYELVETVGI
jgi:hypothetical protein